jgi:hypothetical protein
VRQCRGKSGFSVPLKLWRSKTNGTYYVKPMMRTSSGGIFVTKQIHPHGVAWLKYKGVTVGSELPQGAYKHLESKGWLFTKGEIPYGTEVNWSPEWHEIGSYNPVSGWLSPSPARVKVPSGTSLPSKTPIPAPAKNLIALAGKPATTAAAKPLSSAPARPGTEQRTPATVTQQGRSPSWSTTSQQKFQTAEELVNDEATKQFYGCLVAVMVVVVIVILLLAN